MCVGLWEFTNGKRGLLLLPFKISLSCFRGMQSAKGETKAASINVFRIEDSIFT